MKLMTKISMVCLLAISAMALSQMTLVSAASAAEGDSVDISTWVDSNHQSVNPGASLFYRSWGNFCVSGTGSIKTITLDIQTTNFDLTGLTVQDRSEWNTATDLGSFTDGVWTGQLDDGQCLAFNPEGTVTGELGQQASWSITVLSSSLLDDSANVDPYSENDSSSVSVDIAASADLGAWTGMGNGVENVSHGLDYNNAGANVCNQTGSAPVKSFTVEFTTTNWDFNDLSVADWSTATTHGSIDSNGVWTGQLDGGQCLDFTHIGTVTGQVGEDATMTLTILSSVLLDDSVNPDAYADNNSYTYTQHIVEPTLSEDLNIYSDTSLHAVSDGAGIGFWQSICATGYGEITSFTLDIQTEHLEVVDYSMGTPDHWNTATDMGSITNGVWTGRLDRNQCAGFNVITTVTGDVGQTASITVTIASSTFANDVVNVDPDMSNNSGTATANIVVPADISIATRLITSGEIHAGSNVSYEVDVMNVGAGVLNEGQMGLFYLLPVGATFTSIEDLNSNDILSPEACTSIGHIEDMGAAYAGYVGEVIQCLLNSSTGSIPSGGSYPLQINMSSSESFASGSTQVLGVALALGGGEPDSTQFMFAFMRQHDGFALPINNITRLTYDANPLVVTVNRCDGQAAETTVDDACFTISFSKPVWAPSFTMDDVIVEGGGTVSSLVKDSSTQWTVHVTGMTPGGTVRLLLGVSSVFDYSAVSNGVSVLGENVVRYAVAGDASSVESTVGDGPSVVNYGGSGIAASAGIASTVADSASKASSVLSAASGVVGFTKQLAEGVTKASLIFGSWSLMHSNTLDIVIIVANLMGALALCFIIRAKRRVVA